MVSFRATKRKSIDLICMHVRVRSATCSSTPPLDGTMVVKSHLETLLIHPLKGQQILHVACCLLAGIGRLETVLLSASLPCCTIPGLLTVPRNSPSLLDARLAGRRCNKIRWCSNGHNSIQSEIKSCCKCCPLYCQ